MQETSKKYHSFNLEQLYSLGYFDDLDYYFALSMKRISKESNATVIASCAFLTRMLKQGHICINIQKVGGSTVPVPGSEKDYLRLPDPVIWLEKLKDSPLVSHSIETPLVLDKSDRIYLTRFYDFQMRLIRNIIARVGDKTSNPRSKGLIEGLEQLFDSDTKETHDQKKAVSGALTQKFSVITGGPGTGKTYISKAIKQIFTTRFISVHNRKPDILCLAPTGKAAAKMEQGKTIHRILRPHPSKPGFQYNQKRQLQADLVIVDEASMVDLTLLTRLLEAIPLDTHIILMGDQDQLASVQEGSVFSDICRSKGMTCNIHCLHHNFRSGEKKGIHELSMAINNADFSKVQELFKSSSYKDLEFISLDSDKDVHTLIKPIIQKGFKGFLEMQNPIDALDKINDFKVLCAQNSGVFGTLPINHFCENLLRTQVDFDINHRQFYKMVMITVNDYQKKLFNGDTGVLGGIDTKPAAYFRLPDSRVKKIAYAQLPGHEPAFAITVHKAQGSEYGTVLLLIPNRTSPVLTRQLLYTAVTRAKDKVIVAAKLDVIKAAMEKQTHRNSGICEFLDRGLTEN